MHSSVCWPLYFIYCLFGFFLGRGQKCATKNAHPDFAKRHILIFIAESDTPDPKPQPQILAWQILNSVNPDSVPVLSGSLSEILVLLYYICNIHLHVIARIQRGRGGGPDPLRCVRGGDLCGYLMGRRGVQRLFYLIFICFLSRSARQYYT